MWLPKKATGIMVIAVVTILRVWAMYNRSRLILGILLTLFLLEIIFLILFNAVESDPKNLSGMYHWLYKRYAVILNMRPPTSFTGRRSDHYPHTGLDSLFTGTQLIHLVESLSHFVLCEQHNVVYIGYRSIRQGVTSNVPCDKAVAAQSIRELARQAGHPLLPCVRAHLIIPSLPSPKQTKLTAPFITVSFCIILLSYWSSLEYTRQADGSS